MTDSALTSEPSPYPDVEPSAEFVVLVDDDDCEIGVADKLAAHRNGGLQHRAFSVFLFDATDRLLLQRRAEDKYHFGGRWTNTCCSHPRPGESVVDAGRRRLREEMGVDVDVLCVQGLLRYAAHDPQSDLTEREVDHVLVGRFDGVPAPAPSEAGGWRWVGLAALRCELTDRPDRFTPWFAPALRLARPDHTPPVLDLG